MTLSHHPSSEAARRDCTPSHAAATRTGPARKKRSAGRPTALVLQRIGSHQSADLEQGRLHSEPRGVRIVSGATIPPLCRGSQ